MQLRSLTETLDRPRATGGHRPARVLGLLLLAGAELLGLSLRFDTASLAASPAAWARVLDYAPQALMAGLAALAVLGLILAPRLRERLRALAGPAPDDPWRRALGLHLVLLVSFTLLSPRVLEPSADTSAVLVLAWLLLGLGAALAWLLALAPGERWLDLVGTAVWALGTWARVLWEPLAAATFVVARALLGLVYPVVEALPAERILGVGDFQVRITPACSGLEGMVMVAAFLGVYLHQFRHELRLPQALVLIPLGIAAIWLLNALRIALLIGIGASWSPELAVGGFHSQAGWIGFILVTLGTILLAHRRRLFARHPGAGRAAVAVPAAAEAQLATALLLPWLALMALVVLGSALTQGLDWTYPLRVLLVGALLWHWRPVYRRWPWDWSWGAVGIGVATFVLWLVLAPGSAAGGAALAADLAGLPGWLAAAWVLVRVLGSVVVVPLAEEFAFRGYLLARLSGAPLDGPGRQRLAWPALILSSLAFGLLHGAWAAGTLAGLAFALARCRRGRIMDAVTAHLTTNALIAATVLATGQWRLWA